MNNLILTKEWMKASEDDLILIGEIIHNEILTHLIAFHSQQAVEKSLKALLVFQNIDIPKTHSLNNCLKCVKRILMLKIQI
jgi:HEPN domain-containing protein